jgi:methenyltetrahydrofolate cyclohydrolase
MASVIGSEPDLGAFLDALASRQSAPGGGAAAAMTAALSAALAAMAARSSSRLADAQTIAAEADALRSRAVELADEDGRVYAEVLAAAPRRDEDPEAFRRAVQAANRAPVAIGRIAERATELGERLVEEGSRKLRGDAITGVVLGEAAATAATELVALNTEYGRLPTDDLEAACRARDACRARLERVRTAR